MQSTANNNHSTQHLQLADHPALAALRLSDVDLVELSHQGFLSQEKRGERRYFKLRFRCHGRQIVRYVGNAECAAAVGRELSALQNEAMVLRKLKARAKIANKILRDAKTKLKPLLESRGYAFHGLSLRRPRQRIDDRSIFSDKSLTNPGGTDHGQKDD